MKIPARRILVVVTRRIGDVLLVTPLLSALRTAYPQARLEVLAFRGTGGVLAGNPDIDALLEMSERPGAVEYVRLLRRILRRYDLALSTLAGDRPHFHALLAAPVRVSVVPPRDRRSAWKYRLSRAWTELDNRGIHTVEQYLRLADCLGIERRWRVVPPADPAAPQLLAGRLPFPLEDTPYAVLHPTPKFVYKRWHPEGWHGLMENLRARGLRLAVTGGPGHGEAAYLDALLQGAPPGTANLAGSLTLAQTAELIRRAALFVGTDTAVTHLAAACSVPVVALFGPTNQVVWAPWPAGYAHRQPPFPRPGTVQRVGNVALVQGPGDCVPCGEEGCDRHLGSHSRCLDELPLERVLEAVDRLLVKRSNQTSGESERVLEVPLPRG